MDWLPPICRSALENGAWHPTRPVGFNFSRLVLKHNIPLYGSRKEIIGRVLYAMFKDLDVDPEAAPTKHDTGKLDTVAICAAAHLLSNMWAVNPDPTVRRRIPPVQVAPPFADMPEMRAESVEMDFMMVLCDKRGKLNGTWPPIVLPPRADARAADAAPWPRELAVEALGDVNYLALLWAITQDDVPTLQKIIKAHRYPPQAINGMVVSSFRKAPPNLFDLKAFDRLVVHDEIRRREICGITNDTPLGLAARLGSARVVDFLLRTNTKTEDFFKALSTTSYEPGDYTDMKKMKGFFPPRGPGSGKDGGEAYFVPNAGYLDTRVAPFGFAVPLPFPFSFFADNVYLGAGAGKTPAEKEEKLRAFASGFTDGFEVGHAHSHAASASGAAAGSTRTGKRNLRGVSDSDDANVAEMARLARYDVKEAWAESWRQRPPLRRRHAQFVRAGSGRVGKGLSISTMKLLLRRCRHTERDIERLAPALVEHFVRACEHQGENPGGRDGLGLGGDSRSHDYKIVTWEMFDAMTAAGLFQSFLHSPSWLCDLGTRRSVFPGKEEDAPTAKAAATASSSPSSMDGEAQHNTEADAILQPFVWPPRLVLVSESTKEGKDKGGEGDYDHHRQRGRGGSDSSSISSSSSRHNSLLDSGHELPSSSLSGRRHVKRLPVQLDINKGSRLGQSTPLMLAALRGDVAIVKLLLKFGADTQRRTGLRHGVDPNDSMRKTTRRTPSHGEIMSARLSALDGRGKETGSVVVTGADAPDGTQGMDIRMTVLEMLVKECSTDPHKRPTSQGKEPLYMAGRIRRSGSGSSKNRDRGSAYGKDKSTVALAWDSKGDAVTWHHKTAYFHQAEHAEVYKIISQHVAGENKKHRGAGVLHSSIKEEDDSEDREAAATRKKEKTTKKDRHRHHKGQKIEIEMTSV